MKKIKILLTAITVFAVVGGALAFKVAKFNTVLYCSNVAHINEACPTDVLFHGTLTEPFGGGISQQSSFCTDQINTPCPDFRESWQDQ